MSTIKQLESFLKYCSAKNQSISKNIANVGTKNYKREDVVFKNVFKNELESSLKSKGSRHISDSRKSQSVRPFEIIVDKSEENISGINNVDIEKEMANLAENTINFKFTSQKIRSHYELIRSVIRRRG